MSRDFGVHSPLIDLFGRGDAAEDARLLAAGGQVPLPFLEQVVLIALMTDDPDPAIGQIARETLAALPADGVGRLLARDDTPATLKTWLLSCGFVPADAPDDVDHPADSVDAAADVADAELAPLALDLDDGAPEDEEGQVRQLSSLSVPARIKLAMLGSREQRAVLIRDPNRVVSSAVLSSPKLSETEVENFARMSNVAGEVLRIIGTNRSWMRNYGVIAALVRNPRTPPAISLGLVPRLLERDVKVLSTDRNVPEALRMAARKVMVAKESRRQ